MFRLFAQEIHLDGSLPDFSVEMIALTVEIFGFNFLPSGAQDSSGSIGHGLFSIGDLHRMDVEFLGDLLDSLDAFERF